MKKFLGVETAFYPYLLALAVPILVQNALQVLVGMSDLLMIGFYSKEMGLASVSLANQVFLNILIFFYGLGGGATIFFSRYWGEKNYLGIRQTLSFSTTIIIAMSVLSVWGFTTYAEKILTIMTDDAELIYHGSRYLRITTWSFPFVGMGLILGAYLRSIEKTIFPMWIGVVTTVLNVPLNYIFIFGKFGLSEMGIDGAAYATLIVRILYFVFSVVIMASSKNPVPMAFKDLIKSLNLFKNKSLVKTFLTFMIPVVFIDVSWAVAITVYKKAFAYYGLESVASYAALESFYSIFFVIFYAIGSSAEVIIGKTLGEKNFRRATLLSNMFIKLNFLVALPLSLIMIATARFTPRIFSITPGSSTASYLVILVTICGVVLSIRSLEFLLTIGILRAGGDLLFYGILQTITLWGVAIPTVFLVAKNTTGGPIVLFIIVVTEEILRVTFCWLRLRGQKWIKQITS